MKRQINKKRELTKEEQEIIEIIDDKKDYKKTFLIVGTFVLVSLIIVGLLYLNIISKERVLRNELNKINKTEEVDETIKSSGELKILEKAIKDYYNDYFSYKDIVDETRSDALANLLTPEYLNDNRKKLKNVKKEFVEKNKEFIENIDKMIEMFDEEKILSYLDSSKVSNHNYELYKELMIIPSDKEVLENIKTFKENNQEKQDYLYQLIDVLINSSSSWYVKDDNLYIESNSTLKKYNELRVRIYNLDKSKEV
ncbi:MAG: hypothetical protein J6X02_00615 [Bacilli bacterium]|nr:hypothetical protein [Bacilli bacterium]